MCYAYSRHADTFNLKLTSYNSTGFGPGKPEYSAKLLEACDFLFLQEHWLRPCQFHRIRSIPLNDNCAVLCHNISAMDDNVFSSGRGFGGCSILWKSSLHCEVTPIPMISKRICAVKVLIKNVQFLLFNMYMPCDTPDNILEYMHVFDEICGICNRYDDARIVLGGDLNTSIGRPNSHFTKHLAEVLERERLFLCANHSLSSVVYTFTNPADPSSRHILDHFMVDQSLCSLILSYSDLHEGDNLSFHGQSIFYCASKLNISRIPQPLMFRLHFYGIRQMSKILLIIGTN